MPVGTSTISRSSTARIATADSSLMGSKAATPVCGAAPDRSLFINRFSGAPSGAPFLRPSGLSLWGRASRPPISLAAVSICISRETAGPAGRWDDCCGRLLSLVAGVACCGLTTVSRSAGLLSRLTVGGSRASHHRRGRARVDWKTATTPMARRRPASEREQIHWIDLPRGLPGMPLCGSKRLAGGLVAAQ